MGYAYFLNGCGRFREIHDGFIDVEKISSHMKNLLWHPTGKKLRYLVCVFSLLCFSSLFRVFCFVVNRLNVNSRITYFLEFINAECLNRWNCLLYPYRNIFLVSSCAITSYVYASIYNSHKLYNWLVVGDHICAFFEKLNYAWLANWFSIPCLCNTVECGHIWVRYNTIS